MPDDSSLADILAEMYFKMRIENGLRDIAAGRVVSHNDVKTRMAVKG
ncbi:MAG: hypothetical protein GY869_30895 [Planctomycetes bacterium]|nr:hypothetical protein [Planctomycetota bacterium]